MKITDVSKLRGPLGELNDQLFGENGEERLAEFNLWLKGVMVSILKLVAVVHVCGAKRFVARGAFGKDNPAGIKFFLGGNFEKNFLGKVEENVQAVELVGQILIRSSVDDPIMEELGDCKETTLTYLYELVSRQSRGEAGPLLTNGRANIFYIRDVNGNFWAVHARWCSTSCGWDVDAYSVARPDGWFAGCQVISRK